MPCNPRAGRTSALSILHPPASLYVVQKIFDYSVFVVRNTPRQTTSKNGRGSRVVLRRLLSQTAPQHITYKPALRKKAAVASTPRIPSGHNRRQSVQKTTEQTTHKKHSYSWRSSCSPSMSMSMSTSCMSGQRRTSTKLVCPMLMGTYVVFRSVVRMCSDALGPLSDDQYSIARAWNPSKQQFEATTDRKTFRHRESYTTRRRRACGVHSIRSFGRHAVQISASKINENGF